MINYCQQNCTCKTYGPDCFTAPGRPCNRVFNAKNRHCKVISHRGHSHLAPENTLASVAASITAKADACEFDVRCTFDGHVVLMHDPTVDRTTNGSGAISEMTLAQVQLLDAGQWKNSGYIGQKVPLLTDVFELMAPSAHQAIVELKDSAAAEGLALCTDKYLMTHRVTALSEDSATLNKIKEIQPDITRAFLCTAFPDDIKNPVSQTDWLIDSARKASAGIVDIDYRFISPQMIATLHRAGFEVWVWTVNAPQIISCLIDWNIDAITTDKPDSLIEVLKKSSIYQ